MKQALTVLTVVCIVLSAIPIPIGAAPSGFVGLPDSNIQSSIPQYAQDDLPGPDAFRGSVMTDHGAATLQIDLTTRAVLDGRAATCTDVLGNLGSDAPAYCTDPQFVMQLTDDVYHEGRRVALPAAALADALGYVPDMAYGVHEDGTEWRRPIQRSGSLVVFEVPHFSTQTVTFEGTVSIDATGASDGSSYQYEVSSLDAVSNFTINVTGSDATEWDNETATNVTGGDSVPISPAGNLDPTGPSTNGNPELTVIDRGGNRTSWNGVQDGEFIIAGKDSDGKMHSEIRIDNPPGRIDALIYNKSSGFGGGTIVVDIRIAEGEKPDGTLNEGTLVKDDYTMAWNNGNNTIQLDSPLYTSADTITVEFKWVSGDTGEWINVPYNDVGDGDDWLRAHGSGGGGDDAAALYAVGPDPATNVSVAADDGASASYGNFGAGASQTEELNVTTAATALDVTADTGIVDLELRLKERTQTVDPKVEVNGNWYNYTGTLADGSTHAFDANTSHVQTGTNRVNVSVGDGSLSADAPTPQVNLDYHHTAKDDQSVSYDGEQWSERYNVSRTYSTKQTSAELTIPFDSGHVIEIRGIEKRINNSAWNAVADADYSLSGTTLTVDLGTVKNGATVDVRANGTKVTVNNATIEILEVTTTGTSLDSKIKLTSWNADSYIAVDGTNEGKEIHYAFNESWSGADEYAKFESSGNQHLYLPNAATGSTTRIRTLPVEVVAQSGDVHVRVTDTSASEPAFKVNEGTSPDDTVEYTFLDATTGTDYILYSLTHDIVRDGPKAASSPVTLTDDDSDEELQFQEDTDPSSSSSGDSDSDGTVIFGPTGDGSDPLNSVPVVLLAWAAIVFGAYYVDRRVGQPKRVGIRIPRVGYTIPIPGGGLLFWVVTAVSGVLLLEYFGGGQISAALGAGLEQVGPALYLIFGLIAAYAAWKLVRGGLGGNGGTTLVVEAEKK